MVRCPDKKPFFLFIESKTPNIKTDPGVEAPDVVRKGLGDYKQYKATRDSLIDIIEGEISLFWCDSAKDLV